MDYFNVSQLSKEQFLNSEYKYKIGIQPKIYVNNKFYKLDYVVSDEYYVADQRNALAEEISSIVLKHTNISSTKYTISSLTDKGQEYPLAVCEQFNTEDQTVVQLDELVTSDNRFKNGIYMADTSIEVAFSEIVKIVEDKYQIDISDNLIITAIVDLLILNTDRHLGNMALLVKDDTVEFAPIYDNGLALCCSSEYDFSEYKTNKEFQELRELCSPICLGNEYETLEYQDFLKSKLTPSSMIEINKSKLNEELSNYKNKYYEPEIIERAIYIAKQNITILNNRGLLKVK